MTSQALPSSNMATSPNTVVVTTPSGDAPNTAISAFQVRDGVTYWTAVVSVTQTTFVLQQDTGVDAQDPDTNGPVWKKGFEVQYVPISSAEYGVVITKGTIVDGSGPRYQISDLMIGVFPIPQTGLDR